MRLRRWRFPDKDFQKEEENKMTSNQDLSVLEKIETAVGK
jgi:hypothetical protein